MSIAASPQSVSSGETLRSSLLEHDEGSSRSRNPARPSTSNESGSTNPSSYGSLLAMLANRSPPPVHENIERSAYEAGTSLAHLAWLEMDADVEAMRSSGAPIDWHHKPVSSSSQTALSLYHKLPTYVCAKCGTTLALQDELISKAFSGRDGKAFLFFSILNARMGPREDRQLLTGLHTVADLNCITCQRSVGWCYLRAFEASQRYKEGE